MTFKPIQPPAEPPFRLASHTSSESEKTEILLRPISSDDTEEPTLILSDLGGLDSTAIINRAISAAGTTESSEDQIVIFTPSYEVASHESDNKQLVQPALKFHVSKPLAEPLIWQQPKLRSGEATPAISQKHSRPNPPVTPSITPPFIPAAIPATEGQGNAAKNAENARNVSFSKVPQPSVQVKTKSESPFSQSIGTKPLPAPAQIAHSLGIQAPLLNPSSGGGRQVKATREQRKSSHSPPYEICERKDE